MSSKLIRFTALILFAVCSLQIAGFSEEYSESFLATLPVDIRNSNFIELADWCRRLGLDSSGKRDALERRLYSYYKLEYKPSDQPPSKIVIEKAGLGSYEKVEDAEYIALTGEVYLEMHDEEKGEVHTISADRIIFSENNNTVTAIGNISYILDRGDVQEVFSGERLTFNVDHWGGIFFDGVTEREEQIKEQNVRFRFSGKRIIRNSTEKILLENGTITSSKKDDPYYHISCSRIWVMDEGEWVLENPVVYVGRVPLLYLPFFFKQKNDMFFNPSFGVDNTGNAFFFSTYYIFGEKPKDDEGEFSFMNLGVSDAKQGPKKIQEIFLVDDPDPGSFATDVYEWAKKTESYAKLMVDYYMMMGLFTSVDSKFTAKNVSGNVWMGGAYSYFPYTSGNSKSLYWPQPGDAEPAIVHEYSWLNGSYVPFRFGVDLSTSMTLAGAKLSLAFPWYSDPYFRRVFDNRYESIQWGKILKLEDTGFEEIDLEEKNASPLWKATGAYNVKTPILEPYLNGINIQNLEVSAQLREGTLNRSRYTDAEIAERIPDWDQIKSSNLSLYPGTYFYYLNSMNLPSVSLSLNGTLLGGQKKSTAKKDGDENVFTLDEDLLPPWNDEENADKEPPDGDFIDPDEGEDIPLKAFTSPSLFSHNLSYTFGPSYKREGFFNTSRYGSDEPGTYGAPWEVETDLLYNRIFMKLDPVMTYKMNLIDSMFQFQERVNLIHQVTEFETDKRDVIPDTVWENLEQDAHNQTFTTVNHTFTTTFQMPVPADSGIVSKTSYELTDEAYSYRWDNEENDFVAKTFSMNKESISKSKISSSLSFNVFDWPQKLNADYSFPPNLEVFTYSIQPSIGPIKLGLTHGREEIEEDDWEYRPLVMSLQSNLDMGLSAVQQITYDYGTSDIGEEDVYDIRTGSSKISWTRKDPDISLSNTFDYRFNTIHNEEKSGYFPYSNVTSLSLGSLVTSFTMKDQYGYTFNQSGSWEQSETMDFRPSSLSVRYSDQIPFPSFWKNRIKASLNLNTNTNVVFQKFSQSNLTFDATLKFNVEEFLTFSFTSKSENSAIYLYFPQFTDQLGIEPVNPVTDLINSFAFFDMEKRKLSNYKLNSLSFNLEHQMHDWLFTMTYEGIPESETKNGRLVFDWTSTLTFLVTWSPIPEIKREATYEDDKFSF